MVNGKEFLTRILGGIIDNMSPNKIDKCYLCPNDGTYWEWSNGILMSVCKTHLKLEASS